MPDQGIPADLVSDAKWETCWAGRQPLPVADGEAIEVEPPVNPPPSPEDEALAAFNRRDEDQ